MVVNADLTELDLPSTMTTHFPDPADLLNFTLTIKPDEGASSGILGRRCSNWIWLWICIGMYKGGAFLFSFAINTNYPHDPPKVKCTQTVRPAPLPHEQSKLTYGCAGPCRYTTRTWTWRATSV